MAKGDYYFPLFYKRLLTSTIGWKDDEFGAYLRLLIYQFDNGSIPSDMKELSRIAPSIKKHWPMLSKKFKDDGHGGLVNSVMDEIYHEIQRKKERSKENGKDGGRPRKVKEGELRFYLLECSREQERFYKAGITNDTVKGRFNTNESGNSAIMPYKFQIIFDNILPTSEALRLEEVIRENSERHFPTMKFGGHTECYKISVNVLNIISQTITQKNPAGFKNETETKAIPIINNQKPIVVESLGSENVAAIANSAWSDQHWRQQLCIGLNIKSEDHLKRWMAQFNASVSNDFVAGFNASSYKKMIRGWILKQQEKGTSVEQEQSKEANQSANYRFKKIS